MRLLAMVPGLLTAVSPVPHDLAVLKARIMAADYAADLPALTRLRAEVQPLADDPQAGHLALYWSGFASWRLAMNGAVRGMKTEEIKPHLERALADFEASAAMRASFADAWAAAASVESWLGGLEGGDLEKARERWGKMGRSLARAKALEPGNPRVLWVVGGMHLFAPPGAGGSVDRAIEVYRRMLSVSADPSPQSPEPDWGKPEAFMSLAYAHVHQEKPDLVAAEEEARAALLLQPGWSYVRDILLPQIEAARKEK